MFRQKEQAPIYQQFIGLAGRGFSALNVEHQAEVMNFIQSCQHSGGAFTDRAGYPDYYYSLFGIWLSLALQLKEPIEKHTQFLKQHEGKYDHLIDESSRLLIKTALLGKYFKRPSSVQLFNRMFLKKSQVNIIYRLFLFILIFDALYRKKLMYLAARGFLFVVSPPESAPCSIQAAYLAGRHETGLDVRKEQKFLLGYFEAGAGFKAFPDAGAADLLSTAVALFALKTTEADLRLVAPDCLELIQQNYSDGAFLAGNGDNTRDLEYTFYGLMALGILV